MEKRSSEIEILAVSRDGEQGKTDEVIHEEEVVVRLVKEIHNLERIGMEIKQSAEGD